MVCAASRKNEPSTTVKWLTDSSPGSFLHAIAAARVFVGIVLVLRLLLLCCPVFSFRVRVHCAHDDTIVGVNTREKKRRICLCVWKNFRDRKIERARERGKER